MLIILLGVAILILGITAVVLLIIIDNKSTRSNGGDRAVGGKSDDMTTSEILNKLKLEEDQELEQSGSSLIGKSRISRFLSSRKKRDASSQQDVQEEAESFEKDEDMHLKEPLEPVHGTDAMRLDAPVAEDSQEAELLQQNQDLKQQIGELEQKFQDAENTLQERTRELSSIKADLEVELSNRKEFNKVKDILEKELKDSKEKNSTLQGDLANAQTEADAHHRRLQQLETKLTQAETEATEKEREFQQTSTAEQKDDLLLTEYEKKVKQLEEIIVQKDRELAALVSTFKDLPPEVVASAPPVQDGPVRDDATEKPQEQTDRVDDVEKIRRLAAELSADEEPESEEQNILPPVSVEPTGAEGDQSVEGEHAEEPRSSDLEPVPEQGRPADMSPKDLLKTIESREDFSSEPAGETSSVVEPPAADAGADHGEAVSLAPEAQDAESRPNPELPEDRVQSSADPVRPAAQEDQPQEEDAPPLADQTEEPDKNKE